MKPVKKQIVIDLEFANKFQEEVLMKLICGFLYNTQEIIENNSLKLTHKDNKMSCKII